MKERLRAIVAGGGFGGLTAATALAQRGWSVTIYERQPELRASGSGIYIWENGLRILDAIGAQVISNDSFRGLAMEQRDRDDHVLDPGNFPPSIRLVTVTRKRLLDGLRVAAEKAGVESGRAPKQSAPAPMASCISPASPRSKPISPSAPTAFGRRSAGRSGWSCFISKRMRELCERLFAQHKTIWGQMDRTNISNVGAASGAS
jgi:NAD(P)-binding Rossmann-like domain